jgi:hypothetical protein
MIRLSDSDATSAGTHAGTMFTSLPVKDELSSKVVGLDVYNNANQTVGTIKDVAYSGTSVNGYVIGVDGFLGMGDHYVKTAPEYKYPSNS